MAAALKILCVHGAGRHAPGDAAWQDVWRNSILEAARRVDPEATLEFHFVKHDDLFQRDPPDTIDYLRAIAELLAGRLRYRERMLARGELARQFSLRWTAGMVAQWVIDDDLRQETRQLLVREIRKFAPDVVAAHSLGSLVAYDTFRLHRDEETLRASYLVTLGSQIGNPFVLNEYGGRIAPLPIRFWYHLFNPNDRVFTAPLRLFAEHFEQIDATFGQAFDWDILNHGVHDYVTHPNVVDGVWRQILDKSPVETPLVTRVGYVAARQRDPDRKALLVGINDYPNPADRLEGCVNDAYRLSAALQECDFQPEHIRLVLNERATADAIRERLAWLLDDVQEGDIRFLAYSGHGAQVPTYGPDQEADGFDECLLPWNFNWSDAETLISDNWIYDLYAQLPYAMHFIVFLDCCHSGGLTRAGGPKVRMLSPPDDVRHRALRWDRELGMWVRRDLPPLIPVEDANWNVEDYIGADYSTKRLGRAALLRRHDDKTYDRLLKAYDHQGPYLPMLFQACQEHQVAFEYHDGATAYGAFTFCLTKILREAARAKRALSFETLCEETSALLKRIGYDQEPLIVGPDDLRRAEVPFTTPAASARATRKRRSDVPTRRRKKK